MIVVLADDLSGAAELAGIAALAGLRAEVQTGFSSETDARVVAIDTMTRSLPESEACERVRMVAECVSACHPKWIYKKVDSVLRGHVRAEIEAVLDASGTERALLVPANPGKGRLIQQGQYRVNGVPLNETVFSRDPEFPRWTADVRRLLGGDADRIRTPDVGGHADVRLLAEAIVPGELPAGAAEFFEALLLKREAPAGLLTSTNVIDEILWPALFVCGSAAAWEQGVADQVAARGVRVLPMPENAEDVPAWIGTGIDCLRREQSVMLCIGRPALADDRSNDARLAERLTSAAADVASQTMPRSICLEGGATASAFIGRKGWKRFETMPGTMTGVGVLRPLGSGEAPLLFVKPGSYAWWGERRSAEGAAQSGKGVSH